MSAARRSLLWLLGLALVGLVALLAWWFWSPPYRPLQATFDGDTSELAHTVVVPTLDTPIPDGKSVVWCSSFQIAWDRLRDDVAGGAFQVRGAEDVADRLNRSKGAADDLEAGDYFAAAGRGDDGIVDQIRAGMRKKFPNAPAPDLPNDPDTVVAYAYLRAAVDFDPPYAVSDRPLRFRAGSGEESELKAFGIPTVGMGRVGGPLGKEVEIVYLLEKERDAQTPEFALDLARRSSPYQIVLARLPRQRTLEATLTDLQGKMDAHPDRQFDRELIANDSLLIPFVSFRLTHRFGELQGADRTIQGTRLDGRFIRTALQTVDFRLDPSGARVGSSGQLESPKSRGPVAFVFDRPFLILIRKRGAIRPFFAMWVENAELLLRSS